MTKTIILTLTYIFFFSILVNGQDAYEPNESFSNPSLIICDNFIEASIHSETDKDWYEILVEDSGVLSINISTIPSSMSLNLEVFIIENGSPALITDDGLTWSPDGEPVTSTSYVSSGTYLISVEGQGSNDFSATESYILYASCHPSSFEVNQLIELAAPIPFDTCFADNIWGENQMYETEANGVDQDWFKVEISDYGILNVEISETPLNMGLNLEIFKEIDTLGGGTIVSEIIADDGGYVGAGQNLSATTYIDPGVYYIHVEDQNHNSTNEETYIFCSSFSANPQEINQTIELATAIPNDTCFTDNIWGQNLTYQTEANGVDQDWFKVEITGNSALSVEINDVPSNMGLNLEIFKELEILSDGTVLSEFVDDDGGSVGAGQSLSVTTNVEYGTYYIHVEDQNHNSTSEETYTICVNLVTGIDELSSPKIRLFPNPTSGLIIIENIGTSISYSITNLDGEIVLQSQLKSNTIDLSKLASGLYFIQFINDEHIHQLQLIKL